MRGLASARLLRAWSAARGRHPVDRALVLLAAGADARPAALARLSIAERDAALLRLRAATVGPVMTARVACPACGQPLELAADTSAWTAEPQGEGDGEHTVAADGFAARFRLPDSTDLAAVVRAPDDEAGRRLLAARCVVSAERGGAPVDAAELTEAEMAALSGAMAAAHPLAELLIEPECPACGTRWSAPVDVAAFFWAEVDALARRLLREVHLLARAYGWSEAAVLRMGAARRRAYLEMVLE